MKLLFVLLLSSAVIVSCGKKEDAKITDTSKKDSISQNKDSKSREEPKKNSADGLKNISFDDLKLSSSVKYDGEITAGVQWEDKNGKNVVIITETEETSKGDSRSKELFGYQYIIDGENAKLVWKINDFIKDCPVDIMLSPVEGSLTVTDLNKDGIGESTFLYRMSCKGDVSPDDMKLIMHEGEAKYPIRGSMTMMLDGQKYGGEMKIDAAFDKAPAGFQDYAVEQWKKFQMDKFGR
jgi:hypothetical protein